MTFLAGLELTRRRVLSLRQTRPFSELWIYRRNEELVEEPEPSAEEGDEGEGASTATEPERASAASAVTPAPDDMDEKAEGDAES